MSSAEYLLKKISTDCIGNWKSNYITIATTASTTAPIKELKRKTKQTIPQCRNNSNIKYQMEEEQQWPSNCFFFWWLKITLSTVLNNLFDLIQLKRLLTVWLYLFEREVFLSNIFNISLIYPRLLEYRYIATQNCPAKYMYRAYTYFHWTLQIKLSVAAVVAIVM
jgi:hypothetical protein